MTSTETPARTYLASVATDGATVVHLASATNTTRCGNRQVFVDPRTLCGKRTNRMHLASDRAATCKACTLADAKLVEDKWAAEPEVERMTDEQLAAELKPLGIDLVVRDRAWDACPAETDATLADGTKVRCDLSTAGGHLNGIHEGVHWQKVIRWTDRLHPVDRAGNCLGCPENHGSPEVVVESLGEALQRYSDLRESLKARQADPRTKLSAQGMLTVQVELLDDVVATLGRVHSRR